MKGFIRENLDLDQNRSTQVFTYYLLIFFKHTMLGLRRIFGVSLELVWIHHWTFILSVLVSDFAVTLDFVETNFIWWQSTFETMQGPSPR